MLAFLLLCSLLEIYMIEMFPGVERHLNIFGSKLAPNIISNSRYSDAVNQT